MAADTALRENEVRQLLGTLSEAEGFRPRPYQDTKGVWTIGYGQTGPDVGPDSPPVTKAQALVRLERHLREAAEDAYELWCEKGGQDRVAWPNLPFGRRAALTVAVFQLGARGFGSFPNCWDALRDLNWRVAAAECLDSDWADETPYRALRVARMLLTGRFDTFIRPRFRR